MGLHQSGVEWHRCMASLLQYATTSAINQQVLDDESAD